MGGKNNKPKNEYQPLNQNEVSLVAPKAAPKREESKKPDQAVIRVNQEVKTPVIRINDVPGAISNPRIFKSEVDICDMCKVKSAVFKLCTHKICKNCYEDSKVRKLDHCPICTVDRDPWFLDIYQDILGYKIAALMRGGRQVQNVGCLLTLQLQTKNNRIYCSGTGDSVEMKYFNEYNKFAAERVYVVGVSFFGETFAVLSAMSDYATGDAEIVSLFNSKFIYRVGWEIVETNAGKIPRNQQKVDDRVINVAKTNCCAGIHFFSAAKHAFRYAAITSAINWNIIENPTIFMRRTTKKIKDSNCEVLMMNQLAGTSELIEPAATDTIINYQSSNFMGLTLKHETHIFDISKIIRVELLRKTLEANVKSEEVKIDRYVTKPGFYGLFDVDEDVTDYKQSNSQVMINQEDTKIFHIPNSWNNKLMAEFVHRNEYTPISAECLAFAKSIGYEIAPNGIPVDVMERILRNLKVLKTD